MNKFKVILFDLFFVVSSIVGVGFVTGKEIAHFFVAGKSVVIATIVFFVVFVALSWYFLHIKNKYNIRNLTELNKLAFGNRYEVGEILLMLLFVITSSAMLAGCDYLVSSYLGFDFSIASLILSVVTFFIMLGGIRRIKHVANIVAPLLILMIVINALGNINTNVSMQGSVGLDVIYPIIFCCENFITLIAVLLTTKSKPRTLSLVSGIVLSLVILLSAMAIGSSNATMPMLSLSKGLGNVFFVIYLWCVIFALFTTLQISTYNCWQIASKQKTNKGFALLLIIFASQIIANLGFNFIVQYLYTGVGILGGVYLIALIICLIIKTKKSNK